MKGLAPTMNRSLFLVSVCFCLILAGCSGSQTTTTNLAGTWQNEDDDGTNVITFHSDGTFGGTFNTGSWGIFTPTKVMMSGNWSLDGEQIKYTIKKSSYMNEELSGQIYTDTIMSFQNNTLVLRDESSGENKLSTWIRR
jgi:hypothetical protein